MPASQTFGEAGASTGVNASLPEGMGQLAEAVRHQHGQPPGPGQPLQAEPNQPPQPGQQPPGQAPPQPQGPVQPPVQPPLAGAMMQPGSAQSPPNSRVDMGKVFGPEPQDPQGYRGRLRQWAGYGPTLYHLAVKHAGHR